MLKLKVDGMTCEHCVRAVTRAVAGTPGVACVQNVDLKRGEVTIDGSPAIDGLVQRLADEGYNARLLE